MDPLVKMESQEEMENPDLLDQLLSKELTSSLDIVKLFWYLIAHTEWERCGKDIHSSSCKEMKDLMVKI